MHTEERSLVLVKAEGVATPSLGSLKHTAGDRLDGDRCSAGEGGNAGAERRDGSEELIGDDIQGSGCAEGGSNSESLARAVASASEIGKLLGKLTHGLEAHVGGNRGDIGEHLQGLGVLLGLGIVEEDGTTDVNTRGSGHESGGGGRLGIEGSDIGVLDDGGLVRGEVLLRNDVDTSPNLLGDMGLEVEAGDDTEVGGTTLEGPEEIGVGGGGGLDDAASGEDDLVLDNVVASPAVLGVVEGDTTVQEETRDTDGRDTATDGNETLGLKVLVDSIPSEAGANKKSVVGVGELQLREVGEGDEDTAVNARDVWRGEMSSTADGELDLEELCELDALADIGGGARVEDAGGRRVVGSAPVVEVLERVC